MIMKARVRSKLREMTKPYSRNKSRSRSSWQIGYLATVNMGIQGDADDGDGLAVFHVNVYCVRTSDHECNEVARDRAS